MHNQKIYWNSFEVAKVTFRRSLALPFYSTAILQIHIYEIMEYVV